MMQKKEKTPMQSADKGPILFFDGFCNLCNQSVQFVIKHDAQAKVRFSPLQNEAGQAAREAVKELLGYVPDSLILLDKGQYYTQSDAALHLALYLDGSWKHLARLRIIPALLRNAVYRLIADNRYRLWGKKEACMIPTPALKARFLA